MNLLRQHAEQQFAEELHELKRMKQIRCRKLGDVAAIGGHLSDGRHAKEWV